MECWGFKFEVGVESESSERFNGCLKFEKKLKKKYLKIKN
jgi:hypothetical protein